MRRIAHISDLHFGRIDETVVEALLDELNADPPDLVIASGDFTQRARRVEFTAARLFLENLRAPWLAVPGNHDISSFRLMQRFLDPYRRFRRYISDRIEPCWHDGEIAVVGVNSARRFLPELNWSHGRINHDQMDDIEARFAGMPPHLFRIVVAHHPFVAPPGAPQTRLIGRAETALERFHELGVRLVLAGHLHRGFARFLEPDSLEETTETAASVRRGPAGRLLVVQAGSATSTRLRGEPNAYNRIRIEGGHAEIEPRVWTGSAWTTAGGASVVPRAARRERSSPQPADA